MAKSAEYEVPELSYWTPRQLMTAVWHYQSNWSNSLKHMYVLNLSAYQTSEYKIDIVLQVHIGTDTRVCAEPVLKPPVKAL